MSERLTSGSEEETRALAMELAKSLRAGDVVALFGDLGAGKTRFVRGLAEGLGVDPSFVSSPTFVLMQEYDGGRDGLTLIHVDAYRLSGPDEYEDLGLDDLVPQNALLAIEWAERVDSALPAHAIRVRIAHLGREERAIEIERGNGARAD